MQGCWDLRFTGLLVRFTSSRLIMCGLSLRVAVVFRHDREYRIVMSYCIEDSIGFRKPHVLEPSERFRVLDNPII